MSSEPFAPFPEGEPSAPPIWTASLSTSAGDPDQASYAYGRIGNPTWEALEDELGRLEGSSARVFASGQAASFALLLALGRKRVVVPHDGYYGLRRLLELLAEYDLETVPVDCADVAAVSDALAAGPSALLTETPTNPFLRVFDLAALAQVARGHDAPMVVDNTTATAVLQRPLDLGATATFTSLSKASSGHSDLILGAVGTRDPELLARVSTWRQAGGGIAGPFESWNALRGLRTLPLRIARQSESALALARRLAEHPRVRRVHYPGTTASTLDLARAQMPRGFGPLLSFELDGSAEDAEAVVRRSHLVRPATSFGGVESTWERRARWSSETAPESLIRLSAGIEETDALIADVERALGEEPRANEH
jgi:cystathionine beta-lyase/cystathionine gamma-synthase